MRRLATQIVPVGVLMAAVFFDARASVARPEYTRKTKQECLYCHPPDSFQLTEAGKYYRDHRTLEGYEPKPKPKNGNGVDYQFTSPPQARGAALWTRESAGVTGQQLINAGVVLINGERAGFDLQAAEAGAGGK